jgi:hypothetical protein
MRGDQEAGAVEPAILQDDVPPICFLPVICGGDAARELDVPPQVEFVGDVVEIALGLGLRREALVPAPFVQQLL